MGESIPVLSTPKIHVRTFRASDERAIAALQASGQPLVGPVPPQPLTRHTVQTTFFDHPPNHLWVAETEDVLIGVAGLVHEQPMVARLQMLCIDPDWEVGGVTDQLLQTAVRHCHYFGYLKLVAPTAWPSEALVSVFGRCGLRFTRHRDEGERMPTLLEFYVDLYRRGKPVPGTDADAGLDQSTSVR